VELQGLHGLGLAAHHGDGGLMLWPALLLALAAGDPCRAPFSADGVDRARALNQSGLPGLYSVPAAALLPTGDLWLGAHDAERAPPRAGTVLQDNWTLGIGLMPRLSVALRTFDARREPRGPLDIVERGNSPGATLLLLREGRWWPSLAATQLDVVGQAQTMEATALTASKTLGGRLRLTAGYGQGESALDGAFGGVELAPCDWLRLIAEHDGVQRSVGLRVTPFPALSERLGVRVALDVVEREQQGRGMALSVGLPLGDGLPRSAREAAVVTPSIAPAGEPVAPRVDRSLLSLRDVLIEAGFENIRWWMHSDGTLHVQVEQRRWMRDELDGVGAALGLVGALAPLDVPRLALTMRRHDLPLLTLTTALDAWRAYVADASTEAAFATQLQVAFAEDDGAGMPRAVSRSRFRVDVMPVPRLEAQLMSELGPAQARFSVLPTVQVQLGRGLAVSARATAVLHQDARFIEQLGERDGDQWLLHQALRLPAAWLPRGASGLVQLSAGRFGPSREGLRAEADVQLAEGRWGVGAEASAFGASMDDPRRATLLGSLRWLSDDAGWAVRVTGGQFLRGDVGGGVDVTRRFGRTEIGFALRRTEYPWQASFVVGLPLAPRREWAPGPVRLRAPDFFEHRHTESASTSGALLSGVGASLETRQELPRVFGGRDWLRPVVVRARLPVLREAALRWGQPGL
jgi:hypothetical protein